MTSRRSDGGEENRRFRRRDERGVWVGTGLTRKRSKQGEEER